MFNVFSNYLQPLIEANIVKLTEQSKPSEIFNQLHDAYNHGITGIEYCIRLFVPNPEDEDELVDYIYSNKELERVIRWANRNITINLSKISYKTLGVHIRIVCCMLVKLKEQGKLREDIYFTLHSNLTSNALILHNKIMTEDLPFLPRQPNLDWYSSGAQCNFAK